MNKYNINFITLGCSKNEADTEIMRRSVSGKFECNSERENSDVIVVNTCGFIEDAKKESIDAIVNAAELKIKHGVKYLIVTGCLAQRYPEELMNEIPEIDLIIGTSEIQNIDKILLNIEKSTKKIYLEDLNKPLPENLYKLDVKHTEYIRIAEGCDNNCTYCIIPKLRGKFRSRSIENIYKEAEYLAENGAKEIVLIAQNTSDYGIDLYGKYSLDMLLRKLSSIEKIKWIRLLYLYPEHITEELISEISTNRKVLKYLDIPIQHSENSILKLMNRNVNKDFIINLISELRKRVKDVIIRSTIIVGFPGESEMDFDNLLDFIKKIKFDKLGVFQYSKEEGTPAYRLPNQVSKRVKLARYNELMKVQSVISEEMLREKVGKVLECIIDEQIDEKSYIARSYMDSPDVDGVIYIESENMLKIGDFVDVKVTGSFEYDLLGTVWEDENESC